MHEGTGELEAGAPVVDDGVLEVGEVRGGFPLEVFLAEILLDVSWDGVYIGNLLVVSGIVRPGESGKSGRLWSAVSPHNF